MGLSLRTKLTIIRLCDLVGYRYFTVRMDAINKCNLNCVMCHIDKTKPRTILDFGLYKKIAKELFGKIRFLYLSCQFEPTLIPHFEEYLRVAKKEYNVPFVSFCTNGMLLNDRIIESCVTNKIDEIIISFDGAKKGTLERIRRGAKYETILNNIEKVNSLKKRNKSKYPRLRFNFTIVDHNLYEMEGAISLAWKYGVKTIQFRVDESIFKSKNINEYYTYYHRHIKEVKRLAKEKNIRLLLKPFLKDKKKLLKSYSCIDPWYNYYIKSNGDIFFCYKYNPLGNLKRQKFTEVMESEGARKFKHLFIKKTNKICFDCKVKSNAEIGSKRDNFINHIIEDL